MSVPRKENSVKELSSFWAWCKITACSHEATHNEHSHFNPSPSYFRSASITNLSLDRSGSPMVPTYETSVSPQASRTHMKAETSEDERKILLVLFMFLFVLLCEGSNIRLPCIIQWENLAAFKEPFLSIVTWTSPPGGAENIDTALGFSVLLKQIIVLCGVCIKMCRVVVLESVLVCGVGKP